MDPIQAGRRDLLLAPLLAALPVALASAASASPLDAAQTIIRLPAEHAWLPNKGHPERSVDMCPLIGETNQAGRAGVRCERRARPLRAPPKAS